MKISSIYPIMLGYFGYDELPFIHRTHTPFIDSAPLFGLPVVEISRHDPS